ncbi:uncharacterized protein PEZ65_011449 isoform 2-T2 [Lycodopsis pacificus]
MAAVGAEVGGSWFLTSGVVGFFIVLSIFLTALCSECSRRSFELSDAEADKDPSALIKVAKLEDAVVVTDNPMTGDETDLNPGKGDTVSFTPWRSHLGAPQHHHDVNSSNAPDNIDHTIRGGGSSIHADVSAPLTNHEPGEEPAVCSAATGDSVYARVSKTERPTAFPVRPPEEVLAEEDVCSPPLPDRKTQLEG